jgi:alkylhydroperoxidase/carboxymuconolactone decarboxylase family protein YurZ
VCNFPEEIPVIYEYMLKNSRPEDHMDITRKMREALLKGGALGGLPKTINSLTMLKNVTPPDLRERSLMREGATQENVGAAFFDQVYGKISQRVQNQMSSAYPDLCDYAISHVYAPLLSFTRVLGPKETSLVVIACLIPQDVNPQLKGHLKGALNNGATVEEVMELRNMSMEICRWCGIGWRHEVAKL